MSELPIKYNFEFDSNQDYKETFKRSFTRIVATAPYDEGDEVKITDDLIRCYVNDIGEWPESRELDDISSWLIFGRKGLTVGKLIEVKSYEEEKGLR